MKRIFISSLLFCLVALSLFAEVTFEAKVPKAVVEGQQFRVEFVLNAHGSDFRCPIENCGLQLLAGPTMSSGMSTTSVNGQRTTTITSGYTYYMNANKAGKYTIPAASVKVEGKVYTSQPTTIEVLPPDASSAQRGSSDAVDNGSRAQGISKDDVQLFVDLSKTTVYEGEALLATVKLYFRNTNVAQLSDAKLPDFAGFTVQDIELNNPQATLERYKDANYRMYPLKQYLLFPQRSGEIEIAPASVVAVAEVVAPRQRRGFFDFPMDYVQHVEIPIQSAVRKVKVLPLPAGKPASFMGAVGKFSIKSSLSSLQVKTNEAITYKLVIEGVGNLKYVKSPELEFPSDFEVYDPKVDVSAKTTVSGVSGKKVLEYTIIPRHAGTFEIPALEFSYFDPKAKQYKTLTTEAFTIQVEKGAEDTTVPSGGVSDFSGTHQERLKVLGSDIRYIRDVAASDLQLDYRPLYGTTLYWLLLFTPLALFVVIAIYYRRRLKLNADLSRKRRGKANKVASRRLKEAATALKNKETSLFYEAVHKALLGYVSDKMSIPMSELSREGVEQQLVEHGAAEALAHEFVDVLSTCEFARYAPQSDDRTMDSLFDRAAKLIDSLEGTLRKTTYMKSSRVITLLLAIMNSSFALWAQESSETSAEAVPEENASSAIDARAALLQFRTSYDAGDYASAIALGEQVAATAGVTPHLYYNLGNAYYKDKQYARAILNYERCLLLDPSNEDARVNLEMAGMQTVDKIETIEPTIFSLWSSQLRNLLSESGWAVIAICFMLLAVVGLFLYFFTRRRLVRQLGFFGAGVAFLLVLVSNQYAAEQYARLSQRDYAIVMSPSVTVRSSPAESGTKVFTLHEGTKVQVRESVGEWSEIELSDGNVGWLPSSDVERI